MTEEP